MLSGSQLANKKKFRICTKYFDSSNIFFLNSAVDLPEYTKVHNYFINLINNKKTILWPNIQPSISRAKNVENLY